MNLKKFDMQFFGSKWTIHASSEITADEMSYFTA